MRAIFVLVIGLLNFFSCVRVLWLRDKERDVREIILIVFIIWGVLVWGITELLSLFNQITFFWIALFWIISIAGIIIVSAKINKLSLREIYSFSNPIRLIFSFKGSKVLFFLLPYFLIIAVVIGVIAFMAAPNNWDSMTYHLSRVMHWKQNRSVSFYSTHNLRQLHMGPLAEMAILHLQVLVGSDRLANFVQYFAMIGSVIGVSYIAKLLGGDLKSQLLSALALLTLPMGILQSTSTQNDYVAGFWLVCFMSFALALILNKSHLKYYFFIGMSLGLALLTKATAIIYAMPYIIWLGLVLIKRHKAMIWKPALIIAGIILMVNSGHFARNYSLYGSPLGLKSETGSTAYSYRNDLYTLPAIASNLIRNVGLHLGTPIENLNKFVQRAFYKFHPCLGIYINDQRTTWTGTQFEIFYSRHEDTAGNPIHFWLFLIFFVLLFFFRDIRSTRILTYALCIIFSFILFCILLKWQPWHSRLHLPIFILAMPILGIVLIRFSRYGILYLLMVLLIFSSIPYVINNAIRPLIGVDSILKKNRISQYFKNSPGRQIRYRATMELCKIYNCNQIGLICGANDWEYPLWVIGNSSQDKVRIEHIGVGNISKKFVFTFEPDAIIMTYPTQEKEKIYQGKTYPKVFEMPPLSLFVINSKLSQNP